MYLNPNKDGVFVNIGYSMKLDFDDDGRAAIPLDIDGDGDLDLAVMSLQGLHLAENRSNTKNTHTDKVDCHEVSTSRLGSKR